MTMELVAEVLVSVLFVGGLALHERVAEVVASLGSTPDLVDVENRE